MNVLISQRHDMNKYGQWLDVLENDYVRFFEKFGIQLIPVSNIVDVLTYFQFEVSGIVLSGGNNVGPSVYGEEKELSDVSAKRDSTEGRLLDEGIKREVPILGICRGMQFINAYFGGKIHDDISRLKPGVDHSPAVKHDIELLESDLIKKIGKVQQVNSFHNQGVPVDDLSSSLKAFALATDIPLVEGLYSPEHRLAAIQWHPERDETLSKFDEILIQSFLDKTLFWK